MRVERLERGDLVYEGRDAGVGGIEFVPGGSQFLKGQPGIVRRNDALA